MEKTSPMSVILTCYYKPKPGGLCKRLIRSINALLERGHIVHYLAVEKFPINHKNCFFHRFPWPESKTDNLVFWFFFHLIAPVILLYLGFRYKISHAYAFVATYGFLLQPLRTIKKIPLTVFLRADIVKNYKHKGQNYALIFIDKLLEGIAIINANIYAVSHTLQKAVTNRHTLLKPRLSAVLPNSIDEPSTSFKKEKFNALPLNIVVVGRLDEGKNLPLLLTAISFIKKKYAHLYIFGQGPMEDSIKQLTNDLKINDQVTLMGWQENINLIWESADMLAFPSLYEGSPNTILEALAHNVPVIASDISEHRELLPESCLLDPLDAAVWTEKFSKIVDDPEKILAEIYSDCSTKREEYSFNWESKMVEAIVCD
jgi:glycosyltransferase involved in cell wall biosynthesis